MRYSYCWDFTVEETARPVAAQRDAKLLELTSRPVAASGQGRSAETIAQLVHGLRRWPARAYVRLHAVVKPEELGQLPLPLVPRRLVVKPGEVSFSGGSPMFRTVEDPFHPEWRLWVKAEADVSLAFHAWEAPDLVGRIESGVIPIDGPVSHWWACVDTSSSRLTGASIAGLVVGAMGVFVFTVALRHWLRERGAAMAQDSS